MSFSGCSTFCLFQPQSVCLFVCMIFEDKQSTEGIAVTLLYLGFPVSRGCDQNACFWPIAVSQRVSKGIEPCVDASLLSQRYQVFDAILLNDATHIIGAACIHMQKALTGPGQPLIEIDQHLHQ